MFPIDVPSHFCCLASFWHDGQSSGLYSIASTGTIYSIGILQDAIIELERCIRDTKSDELGVLTIFRDWLMQHEMEYVIEEE